MSSPAVRRTGKGIRSSARACDGFPSPPLLLRPGMTRLRSSSPHVITGLVPVISIVVKRRAFPYRDGRHKAGHDVEGDGRGCARATLCSHFVLDRESQALLYRRGSLLRGARSRGVAVWEQARSRDTASQARPTRGPGCVPLNRDWVEAAADLAVTASGSRRTGTACPPKKAVREAASRLFHHHHASSSRAALRATLDLTTGSEPNGSGPTGAGLRTGKENGFRDSGRNVGASDPEAEPKFGIPSDAPLFEARVVERGPLGSARCAEPGRELAADGLAPIAVSELAAIAQAQGREGGHGPVEPGLRDQAVASDGSADDQERIAPGDELVDRLRQTIAEGVPPAEEGIAREAAIVREIAGETQAQGRG